MRMIDDREDFNFCRCGLISNLGGKIFNLSRFILILGGTICPCFKYSFLSFFSIYGNKWQNEESDRILLLTSAYISPLCNLWAHIFKLFSTLLAIPRKNGPKIGSRGHSNQTTTMFGQWQFITYSAPKLDANQTRYLQFLDSTRGVSDWILGAPVVFLLDNNCAEQGHKRNAQCK